MAVRIDRETFLKRAMERFGHRYSYEDIEYRSYRSPIKIRCLDHPVRLIVITPERHLQTTGGCKYCLRAYRQQAMASSVTVSSVSVAQAPLSQGASDPERQDAALRSRA
ncbi:hypothetical protein AAJV73_14010 [Cyanobium sp. BSA11S]|jgi:hypothetical protein|uniref:hypothetical protein n=2 Tax=Cyanophyceae TaxID=3028117 RepID=UPI002106A453|nr:MULTISPECIES: hypothetical protein [unclassified Synechococcus]